MHYTNVGKPFIEPDAIKTAVLAIEWKEAPITMGFSQGYAIREAIKEFKVPDVSHVGESIALAKYGFYGIRGHYSNGIVQLYFLDIGTAIVPVATELIP